jgi:hypothetical protein
MTVRKTVILVEEINSEYGASPPPLGRVAIGAVSDNSLAGQAAGAGDIRSWGRTGSERRAVKVTRLTPGRLQTFGHFPLVRRANGARSLRRGPLDCLCSSLRR